MLASVMLGVVFSIPNQEIGLGKRLRNDLFCVECDVKPQLSQQRCVCVSASVQETEKLESEQAKLQDDIKAFQREKDELEFILDAHRLHCGMGQSTDTATTTAANAVTANSSGLKVEPSEGKVVVLVTGALPIPAHSVPGSTHSLPGSAHSTPGSSHLSVDSAHPTASSAPSVTVRSEGKGTSAAARRPNSLVTPPVSGLKVTGSQVAGVSITTPSAGINVYTLGLESMLDGHTGLTPITGLPVSLAGLSTPIFAIPATVAGIAVEETTSSEVATTGSGTT